MVQLHKVLIKKYQGDTVVLGTITNGRIIMRKIILAAVATLMALIFAGQGFCAGTYSYSSSTVYRETGPSVLQVTTVSLVADSADASFPAAVLSGLGGSITSVQISDDGVQTDGTISISLKVTGTNIEVLDTSQRTDIDLSNDYAVLTPENSAGDVWIADTAGALTLQVTGGGVNSAALTIIITTRG